MYFSAKEKKDKTISQSLTSVNGKANPSTGFRVYGQCRGGKCWMDLLVSVNGRLNLLALLSHLKLERGRRDGVGVRQNMLVIASC